MQIFAHAGIGWILAEAGRGDRRLRQAVFLSALLPDMDGLSVLFGLSAYETYHDRITHSIPFAILISAICATFCHRFRFRAVILTQIAFLSHILADYFLSGWPIALWFPINRTEILSAHALWLGHPVNHLLNLLAVVSMAWLGKRLGRTPFEVVSVALDQRICNWIFRTKTQSCSICGKPANEFCSQCGNPVCVRHAPLAFHSAITCSDCKTRMAGRPPGG